MGMSASSAREQCLFFKKRFIAQKISYTWLQNITKIVPLTSFPWLLLNGRVIAYLPC
jgi:hypothetical protein